MENLNGLSEEPGAERLRQLRFGRTRDSNEWTLEQKWNYVLQAFTRFIDSEKALGEAKYNSDGHLVLIYASDGYYAIKESIYQSAQNLESRGFRLQELRAKYQKGIGLLPMEVLMHRPLGNNPNYTPCEFYNKSSLYPLAFTDMKGECMQKQLQVAIVVREQKNGVCEMVHKYALSDLTDPGGQIDQALYSLAKIDVTCRKPTNAQERDIDDLTPMAIALHQNLKKHQPRTMQKVIDFIRNKAKDDKITHGCFNKFLQNKFRKERVEDRYKGFIKLFPDKFEFENNEVRIARNKEPWPHPPGLPYPYETQGWREVGITAELAAEVCILSGHPCLVMHNTTLIYERYPECWTKDLRVNNYTNNIIPKNRFDLFIGITFQWIVPLKKRTTNNFYYY